VYDNIGKFLTYILTSNVPEVVPYVAFAFFGWPLALTVPQILAVDLGTDLVPALGLGAERAEPGVMERPPRPRDGRLITPGLLSRAYLFLGLFEAAAAMTAFAIVQPRAGYVAATTACLAAIVVMQVANVLLCRSDAASLARSLGRWNALIALGVAAELGLLLAIAYTPIGQRLFGTAPLDGTAWLLPLPFAVAMLLLEEARKWAVRRFSRRAAPAGAPRTPHAPAPPRAPGRAPA
jgi:magnesium-transporting ATPase (P-type)